jgi:hypothetical protein
MYPPLALVITPHPGRDARRSAPRYAEPEVEHRAGRLNSGPSDAPTSTTANVARDGNGVRQRPRSGRTPQSAPSRPARAARRESWRAERRRPIRRWVHACSSRSWGAPRSGNLTRSEETEQPHSGPPRGPPAGNARSRRPPAHVVCLVQMSRTSSYSPGASPDCPRAQHGHSICSSRGGSSRAKSNAPAR